MATDHPEDNEPSQGNKNLSAKDRASAINAEGDRSSVPDEQQTCASREKECEVIKRSTIGSLAQFQPSNLYKSQFSAAEHMRKIAIGSAAEEMRRVMGGSIGEQLQNIVRGSIGEQMRQIEQAIHPINTIQDAIGHLARSAAETPMRRFLDEQASRHRQMMELLHPKWDQTLVGSALSDSFRAIQALNSFPQAEALRTRNAIVQQFDTVANLFEALRPKLPSFDQLSEFWLRYPARVKENLVALASAGWYLDPEMSIADIIHFKEDLENRTVEEVNDELVQHFRSSLDRIEASLCDDHPTRAPLIKEAFAAHREGRYSLSIPALFAQADGICLDMTGYQIFTGKGLVRFAKRIDPETLERAYLEPLLRDTPITESSRQRRANIPQLNRHAVMHGESTDFPSEENGLKAISFIHFVSHVLGMAIALKQ